MSVTSKYWSIVQEQYFFLLQLTQYVFKCWGKPPYHCQDSWQAYWYSNRETATQCWLVTVSWNRQPHIISLSYSTLNRSCNWWSVVRCITNQAVYFSWKEWEHKRIGSSPAGIRVGNLPEYEVQGRWLWRGFLCSWLDHLLSRRWLSGWRWCVATSLSHATISSVCVSASRGRNVCHEQWEWPPPPPNKLQSPRSVCSKCLRGGLGISFGGLCNCVKIAYLCLGLKFYVSVFFELKILIRIMLYIIKLWLLWI